MVADLQETWKYVHIYETDSYIILKHSVLFALCRSMIEPILEEYLDKFKCLEAKCCENTLEKSGLEPSEPNRLADRKHCALSTQPNHHVHCRWGFG